MDIAMNQHKYGNEFEILNLIDESIVELDEHGNLLFVNDKACRLLNMVDKAWYGMSVSSFLPLHLNTTFYSAINRACSEKVKATYQLVLEPMHVNVWVKTIPSSRGIVVQVTESTKATHDESDEMSKFEFEIDPSPSIDHLEPEKFLTLFNTIDIGFCIIEVLYDETGKPYDFRYKMANPALEKHTGIPDVIGKTVRELTKSSDPTTLINICSDVQRTGKSTRLPYKSEYLQKWFDMYIIKFGKEEDKTLAVLFNDVTEQTRAQEELRKSQSYLAAFIEAVPIGMGMVDTEGKLIVANKEMQRFLPNDIIPSRDEDTHWRWSAWYPNGEHVERENFPGARALRGERVVPGMEMLFTLQDGSKIWTSVSSVPVTDNEGKIIGTVSAVTDINELKLSAVALRRSEEQLKKFNESLEMLVEERTEQLLLSKKLLISVFNSSLNFVAIFEAVRNEKQEIIDFTYIKCNELVNQYIGEDPSGKLISEVPVGLKETPIMTNFKEVVNTGNAADFEILYNDEKNGGLWYRIKAVKLGDGLVAAGENITPKKIAEEELLNLKLMQQKEILIAVLNTQEEERKRISESLHNGLGQLLYAAKIRAEYIKPDPSWSGQQKLKLEIDQLLENAIDQTRNISLQLSPQLLQTFGLREAIEEIVNHFRSDSLSLNYQFLCEKDRFNPDLEISVFRMVQELVNNIVKHSKATAAWITIECIKQKLIITAQDNGQGFENDFTAKKKNGMGMNMIENRIKLMNGTMQIESEKNKGTKITIVL